MEEGGRGGGDCGERDKKKRTGEEEEDYVTHDFDVILREIPAFVYSAVLALAHGRPAEVMI